MTPAIRMQRQRKARQEKGLKEVRLWLTPEAQDDLWAVQNDGPGYTIRGAVCGALHQAALAVAAGDDAKTVLRDLLADYATWSGHNDDGFTEELLARARQFSGSEE